MPAAYAPPVLLQRFGRNLESARRRRRVANKDMREVVAEILKQKPKTVEGLRMQAVACVADPDAKLIEGSNMVAFLTSVIEYRKAESAQGV
jgi:hypothetical protein